MKTERVLQRIGPTYEEVVINKSFFYCGRMKDRDLVCLSLLVSREHCVFTTTAEGLSITDFGSSNGVFVNGEIQRPRKQIFLKENDIVGIGCCETSPNNLDNTMFVYRLKSRLVDSNDCDSTSNNKEEKATNEVANDVRNNEERTNRKEQSRVRKSDVPNIPIKVPKTVLNHQQAHVTEICNIIDDDDDDDIIEIIELPSSSKLPVPNETNGKPLVTSSGESSNTSVNSKSSTYKVCTKNQSNVNNEMMEVEITPAVPIVKKEAPVHVDTVTADAININVKQEPPNNVEDNNGSIEVKQESEFCFSQIDLIELDDEEEFPCSQLFDKTSIKEEQEDCPEGESLIFLDDDENLITILDSDDENENSSEVNKDIYSNVRIKQECPELSEFQNRLEMFVSHENADSIENAATEAELELATTSSKYKEKSANECPVVPFVEEFTVDPLAVETNNEMLADPLVTENVDKTFADPLIAEHIDDMSADPLVAEHVNNKVVNDPVIKSKDKSKVRKPVEIVEPHTIIKKRRSGKSEKSEKKDKKKSKEFSKISSDKKKKLSDLAKNSSSKSKSKESSSKDNEASSSSSKKKDKSKSRKDKDDKTCTSPENSKENEGLNDREKASKSYDKNDSNNSNSLQNTTASAEVQKKNKMTNVKVKISTKSRGDMLCDSMQALRPVPKKSVKKTTEEAKITKPIEISSTFVIPRRQVPLSSSYISSSSKSNLLSSSNSTSSDTEKTETQAPTVTSTDVDNRVLSAPLPSVTPIIVNHMASPSHSENDDRVPSPLLAREPVVNPLAVAALKTSLNSSVPNKKKVSFKENIVAVREFPIEAGNQMRNIRDGLNLRANRREGIHRPLDMKLQDFLARIFAWEPVWLEQQQKVKDLPPIVKKEEMQQLPTTFNSYEQYYKRMEVLLLLETWQLLYKEYECTGTRYKQSQALHCSFLRHNVRQMQTPNGLRYSELAINTLVTNKDLRMQNHPVFGDMIILEYVTIHEGHQKLKRAFAYVVEVKQQNSLKYLRSNGDNMLIKYCPHPDALMTYIVQTRIIDEHTVLFNKVARLRSILYLRSHLRLIQGLQFVPHSSLRDSILNVDIDDFQLEPVTNEQIFKYDLVTREKLNEKQMEAVIKFTNASIKLEPKIGLLVGPPGTGKSKVIANLVTQILYGEGRYVNLKHIRILVCAPSNAAIDEIVLRLLEIRAAIKDYRFKMVRIGRMESMHEEVKKISVTELAKREAQKTYSEHQQKNCESMEQQKHKLKKEIDALELLLASNPLNRVYQNNLADLKSKFFKLANKSREEEDAEMSKYQHSAKTKIINKADVIACTLSSCYTSQMESIFGIGKNVEKIATCIVDEATQCCEAETLIPLMLGVKSLILVGDPNQLPATVMSTEAKKLGLDRSLFTRAKSALESQCDQYNYDQNDPVIMLNIQYRMVNAISHWPNKHFYGGKLIDRVNYKHAFPFQPYRVLNLDGVQDDIKFSNTSEAVFVGNLINCLMTCSKAYAWDGKLTIGVITPYQNQKSVIMNTIKEQIKNVPENIKSKFVTEVNTIDSFQGQERDVIIMSCVRSCGIGFLSDQQRLCVALTRAKFSLIICGNFTTFQRDSMWKDLLSDARSRGVVARLNTRARPIDIKPHVIRLDL